jgi:hypothetical protein
VRPVLDRRTRSAVSCAICICALQYASLAPSSADARITVLLSVAPIPTVANPAPGTPKVTWSTGNGSPGEVTVSVNGGKEVLYAASAKGSSTAPWISAERAYVFRLYSRGAERRLLARLKVGQPAAVIVSLPHAPPTTSPIINRLLQIFSFGGVLLLALLTAMYIGETRQGG